MDDGMTIEELKAEVLELLTDELAGFANNHPWLQPAIGRSLNRTKRLFEQYEAEQKEAPNANEN